MPVSDYSNMKRFDGKYMLHVVERLYSTVTVCFNVITLSCVLFSFPSYLLIVSLGVIIYTFCRLLKTFVFCLIL